MPSGRRSQQTRPPRPSNASRGLVELLLLGLTLTGAACALGARTWQVGVGLGPRLFRIEDIVELAAVSVGTVLAGWAGLHALLALTWVLAHRRGLRWAAGQRIVTHHAPAVVRRLARAAVGTGIGLALAAPTAMALPGPAEAPRPDDAGAAVVVELGWQPTGGIRPAPPGSDPERTWLINRGRQPADPARDPVVVVEPGDTLWAIATDRLARTDPSAGPPSDAAVAAAVERWHTTNRAVLGADRDLIHPGTVLRQP